MNEGHFMSPLQNITYKSLTLSFYKVPFVNSMGANSFDTASANFPMLGGNLL